MTTSERQTTAKTQLPLQERMKALRRSAYRQAIAEAAERVFAEKGTDCSHMRDIAAEAGVSLGTLYGVIEGKKSLLADIQSSRMREFLDCIRSARDSHRDTLASHLAVVRDGAQYFLDRPDFLRMCRHAGFGWATRPKTPAPPNAIWNEGASIPRELFARGIAEGIYVEDEPELMVRKMLALKEAELAYWADHEMDTPHAVVLERLESQFIRAFCVPNQPRPESDT